MAADVVPIPTAADEAGDFDALPARPTASLGGDGRIVLRFRDGRKVSVPPEDADRMVSDRAFVDEVRRCVHAARGTLVRKGAESE